MFEINYQLCKEFPAYTPDAIDRKSYHSVIRLFCEVRTLQIREQRRKDPNRPIRRRAGDDWF